MIKKGIFKLQISVSPIEINETFNTIDKTNDMTKQCKR